MYLSITNSDVRFKLAEYVKDLATRLGDEAEADWKKHHPWYVHNDEGVFVLLWNIRVYLFLVRVARKTDCCSVRLLFPVRRTSGKVPHGAECHGLKFRSPGQDLPLLGLGMAAYGAFRPFQANSRIICGPNTPKCHVNEPKKTSSLFHSSPSTTSRVSPGCVRRWKIPHRAPHPRNNLLYFSCPCFVRSQKYV